jgi:hypothetical protein
MNKDKKVILGLIIVIIVLIVGGFAFYAGKISDEKNVLPVVENTSQQKESCLIVTSPIPNQAVSFPLNIEGYIDLVGAKADTCTKWSAFEGTAGNVVVKDANGNVKSSLASINTVGDYYEGMKNWPIKATVQKLTGDLSADEISLYLTSDNASGDPSLTASKIIQPLKVISSVSTILPQYIGGQEGWPPVIKTSLNVYSCNVGVGVKDKDQKTIQTIINGKNYCVYSFGDAGMGHVYRTYTYTTAFGSGTKTTTFTLNYSTCGGYGGPGDAQYDQCKKNTTSFNLDAIIGGLM